MNKISRGKSTYGGDKLFRVICQWKLQNLKSLLENDKGWILTEFLNFSINHDIHSTFKKSI